MTKLKVVDPKKFAISRYSQRGDNEALVTRSLGDDIAISFYNQKASTVALARQIDPDAIVELFNELIKDKEPSHFSMFNYSPPVIQVQFVGGRPTASDNFLQDQLEKKASDSYHNNKSFKYYQKVMQHLTTLAGNGTQFRIGNEQIEIRGNQCVFNVIGVDILDKKHPESVCIHPQYGNLQEFSEPSDEKKHSVLSN